jgi:hypothetical protein
VRERLASPQKGIKVSLDEEVLYSLSDVERELRFDGDATCR